MDDAEFARIEHQLLAHHRLHQEAERRAWQPIGSIEALALKVLGGWEMLKSDVNWAYFHSVGPGGPPAKTKDLPATIRKVAETYNVRWPHDEWSAGRAKAGLVRQKLAHLLYVLNVDEESASPNRKLAFVRLGAPGEPRIVDGRPGELEFRDDVWSMQTLQRDIVTEQELADALGGIKWLVDCCHFLQRLGDLLNSTDAPWPDDYELPQWERDMLVWWFPDWGDRETAVVTAGQLRVKPLGGR